MLKLQAKGNLDYSSAIGQEGTVYVTIPGGDEDGGGQIQINIQGRYTTASARKVSPGSLKPGQRVKVTGVNGPAFFVVEEA
jgi:membrane protein implicated in regulation of membrane protease activity